MEAQRSSSIIDFHSHYYEEAWLGNTQPGGALARAWPLLTDIQTQLRMLDEAGIDAKVLSAPGAALLAPGEALPLDLMRRINDRFAELIAAYPGRLWGLATIDAFHGDAAAREVERAHSTLGLGGICVDCARGDLLLDATEARPALEAAAALGMPVFVHPISPVGLTERLTKLGHVGILLARGTETAASVLAMLRTGIFEGLPELKVMLPMIAGAAFLFAGMADQEQGRESGWPGEPSSEARKRLYVDTMGFDAAMIRFAVNLLGHEHVLVGSDWPIMPLTPRQRVEAVLMEAGLSAEQQTALLGTNTARLLQGHRE